MSARPVRHVQPDGRVHGVVVGVRRVDGRWLMVRRGGGVAMPHKVCFPGGAVEAGETEEQACIREAREELGLVVRPIRRVWRHDFEDKSLTLFGWLAEVEEGAITADPLEIAEVLWLTGDEGSCHPDGLVTNSGFIAALEGTRDLRNRPRRA